MSKNLRAFLFLGCLKVILCSPYILFIAIYVKFLPKSKKKSFLNRDWAVLSDIGSFITLLALLLLALKALFFS